MCVTIVRMMFTWIAIGTAVVAVAAVVLRRLLAKDHKPSADPGLGTVSAGWLSEQRARKDR